MIRVTIYRNEKKKCSGFPGKEGMRASAKKGQDIVTVPLRLPF